METRDAPAPLTRPLAWLGLRKSAMDLAVEPPLSPMAPVDLDDDGAVTDVLNLALEIGGILLSSGEGAADTVAQAESVAAAFGLPGATVEVTFTSLTIGVNRRRGRPPISVIRVVNYRTVDMTRVTRVSRLIDLVVRRQLTVDQATAEVEKIVASPHPHSFRVAVLGWAMLGCAVVIQLGGSPLAGLISMVSTFALMYANRALDRHRLPSFFQQVVGGFIAAAWALAAYVAVSDNFIEVQPSQLVAAGIIVLLAGLTLVGAIEDAITGFPVTSAGRGVETMVMTGGVLGGITIGLAAFDRLGMSPPPIDPAIAGNAAVHVAVLAAGVGAAGFAVASYATVRSTWLAAAVGATGMLIFQAVTATGLGVVVGSALAACTMGLFGGILARIATVPPLVVTVAGITPFLPGLSVYRGLSALTSDQTGIGLGLMFQALAIAVALAAGIVFGEWVTRNLRRSAAADQ
ncbi:MULTISPECIES: threonine/serine ThrE exporter family protein [Dietzia]|uniref:threonine/serine ThrE exporter family protein n=1 Tax=Dietzia TaxID=37914 RepID=UPI0020C391FD|nr:MULTISPECIES: threonine/serine exporter family protein [Dietzia]MCT1712411.1 threonine/serine exporter family protein [Dietzia cinnamea]MCT2274149.1 threonine/serine exporter family protein [Dietzia cinnamea]